MGYPGISVTQRAPDFHLDLKVFPFFQLFTIITNSSKSILKPSTLFHDESYLVQSIVFRLFRFQKGS
jgi:hypothetical protein